MTFVLAWVALPAFFVLNAMGLGLLIQRACGSSLPRSALLGLGTCGLIVTTTITTAWSRSAGWSGPILLLLALTGWIVGGRQFLGHGRWGTPTIATGLAFLCFAAPVALAGQVSWAGYVKLDDTATWLALADQLATEGRVSPDPNTSTFGVLTSYLFASGYPVGAIADLGVLSRLVGTDTAWLAQPLMACLGAALASTLYSMLHGLVRNRAWRAATAVVSAQAALLFGFTLWGGLKEISLAVAWAACFMCLAPAIGTTRRPRRDAITLGVCAAAVAAIFGVAAAFWLLPLGCAAVWVYAYREPLRQSLKWAGLSVATFTVLSLPTLMLIPSSIATARAAGALLDGSDIGNLRGPLKFAQVAGIWMAGDFREDPVLPVANLLLVMLVGVLAVLGLVTAVERRHWRVAGYLALSLALAGAASLTSSPWLSAKTFAVVAPATLCAAGAGLGVWAAERRRAVPLALGVVVAIGVLASNFLAYSTVWLAPSDQMQELASIGHSALGKPTLMLEYNPVAARHFLRDSQAEGAGELRYRHVPLLVGGELEKGTYADIDEFSPSAVDPYQALVLRTSVADSRPPSSFVLAYPGRFYNVWLRDNYAPRIIEHWPLGGFGTASSSSSCAALTHEAQMAGPSGMVAAAIRAPRIVVPLSNGEAGSWIATDDSEATATFTVETAATYQGSLGGSYWGGVSIIVDGNEWFSGNMQINWDGNSTPLPPLELAAGHHTVVVKYVRGLSPGARYTPSIIGPLQLATISNNGPVTYALPSDAARLCGLDLDWVEAVKW